MTCRWLITMVSPLNGVILLINGNVGPLPNGRTHSIAEKILGEWG